MLEAGKADHSEKAWQELHPDFIARGHRIRLMRRAAGLVVIMTAVSALVTANTTSGLSGLFDTLLTVILGAALALFIWRLALSGARDLARLIDIEVRKEFPEDENGVGDPNHPSVIFAPWIPNTRRGLRDVLLPFALRRKR